MMASYKGSGPVSASYACGGDVLNTTSKFLKTPDSFRTGKQKNDFGKKGKGGELSKTEGDSKKLKAIKPRT
jgi:hypothetical protein